MRTCDVLQNGPVTLLGPIQGGRHGWAFAAATRDVGAFCYVEEEYFLEGQATPYEWPLGATATPDGRWRVVEDEPRPFRTRLLVRRPVDPAHFNGVVVVCWVNVTAGFEVIEWETDEALNGYAWAFVSAQRVGVHGFEGTVDGGLVGWDPDRYGTLHIDHDDLSYDIFTHAAEAVGPHRRPAEQPDDVDPMDGLDVRFVLAVGSSQSAARLATYRNAVQRHTEAFDGFLLDSYFGVPAPLGDDPILQRAPSDATTVDLRSRRGTHRLRTDLDVATLVFLTECETQSFSTVRQPADDHLRFWEVAGASHYQTTTWIDLNAKAERDLGEPFIAQVAAGRHVSDFDVRPARDAALHTLTTWVRTGEPPPDQPWIELRDGQIARDEDGNALGGVRLPEFDVPLACYRGTNDLPGLAWLGGSVVRFSTDVLRRRYRDRDDYVTHFERAARAAGRHGVLLPRDRDRLVEEARRRALW